MEIALIILVLVLLAFAGTPLFVIITAAAMIGFYYSGVDLSVITIEIYRITSTPLLLALPLFTFAGYLLSESNTSKRLVHLSRSLLGWLPAEMVAVTLIRLRLVHRIYRCHWCHHRRIRGLTLSCVKASWLQ